MPFPGLGQVLDLADKYSGAIQAITGTAGLALAYKGYKNQKKQQKKADAVAAKAERAAAYELADSERRVAYRNKKSGSRRRRNYSAFSAFVNPNNQHGQYRIERL